MAVYADRWTCSLIKMSIPCNICSELLQASDDAFATPCGHLFHFSCITRWLLGSSTCPYCRKNVTQSDLHPIYLRISDDIVKKDSTALQHRIDSLLFEICVKYKEIRRLIRKLRFFKKKGLKVYLLRGQVNLAKKRLVDLKNTKILLLSPQSKVNKMIRDEKDSASLATQLCSSMDRNTKNRNVIVSVQGELNTERHKNACVHLKLIDSQKELASCKSRTVELEKEFERLTTKLHGGAISTAAPLKGLPHSVSHNLHCPVNQLGSAVPPRKRKYLRLQVFQENYPPIFD